MDKEPTQNTIENTESVDMEQFGENIKNASPSTLLKIKEVMKRPETWTGIATMVMGSIVGVQVFEHSEVVKENWDDLGKSAESFRGVLNAYKVFASGVFTMGVLVTMLGISKGGDIAKQKANLEQ
ncbi:hypothetical protein IPJ63_01680 [Candidatus Nomurabacteria bacterium]|nr:MAG: hypothetical protein IPJ63_01680 [Candidatus Nomurabacteria bacterium]